MSATTIAITIRKGGSAKTTTAVNLASGLAKQGKKVLLVDLDSQSNASMAMGVPDTNNNLASVLGGEMNIKDAIQKVGGFDLLASTNELAEYEPALISSFNLHAIKQHLDVVENDYDFIVIDTPPNDGIMTRNGLVASDYAVIPVQAQTLAIKGLRQALNLLESVKQTNPNLKLLGILPTCLQAQTNVGGGFMKQLQTIYPNELLPFSTPLTIKVPESQLMGQAVVDYAPDSPVSKAYLDLAKYTIKIVEGSK